MSAFYTCGLFMRQIYVQGQRQDFGWGDIGQNFLHDFLSSPVLQWRRQNFGSVGTFSKNLLIKDF